MFSEHELKKPNEVLTDETILKQWNNNLKRKNQSCKARATYEAGSILMANLINQGYECNATILARTESEKYVGCKRKVDNSSKTQNELLKCMDKTIGGRVAEEIMAKTRNGKCFIKKSS